MGRLCGVVANVQNCDIVVSEFKLKLRYYIRFQIQERYEHFVSLTVIVGTVLLLSFCRDGFGIK